MAPETPPRGSNWITAMLLWMVPAAFLLMALGMAVDLTRKLWGYEAAVGEVIQVYQFEDSAPWRKGEPVYAPVFRYRWSDGELTEATAGASHKDWNFEVGSRHNLLYAPDWKNNVLLPGFHNWMPILAVAGIGVVLAVPSAALYRRMTRRSAP